MTKFARPAILASAAAAMFGAAVTIGTIVADTDTAAAYSQRVKNACKGDYYAHCPGYEIDSPQLRACMRRVGKRLSKGCIDALIAAGEIKKPRK